MARFLLDGEWYEEISATALYETELEQIIMDQAPYLYPDYRVVPFKQIVYSDTESHVPDFALIDQEYREWWVVEVEMGSHSLNGHVLPQVRTFSEAAYGVREAQYLCSKLPSLDEQAVLGMMKGRQPRVLVLVNTYNPDWVKALAPYEAAVGVFEVFRSDRNQHAFMVNGQYPKRLAGIISECTLDPIIPRLLRIESPAAIPGSDDDNIRIRYKDQMTEWERIESQTDVWLNPIRTNPLLEKRVYELVELGDGTLEIRARLA